jgi:hypothetical protein
MPNARDRQDDAVLILISHGVNQSCGELSEALGGVRL